MDRLIAEKEPEVEIEAEQEKKVEEKKETSVPKISIRIKETPKQTEYLNSLENITVADFKKREEDRKKEEFKIEKEELIQKQFVQKKEVQEQKVSQNVIEKPNYDFIDENKKVVKLKQKTPQKKRTNRKLASIVMACVLGGSAIIAVANMAVISNLNSSLIQIDETYNLNLQKYLKKIKDLDATQKSMELLETYPEEVLDSGDLGQKSNWFDRICNFIAGIFGG